MSTRKWRIKRDDKIFDVTKTDQQKTVTDLFEESRFSQTYYFRLLFSSVIVVAGILMDNLAIVLAGMLVAPLLTPILTIAMGIALLNWRVIVRSLIIVAASIVIIVGVSAVVSIIYGPYVSGTFVQRIDFNILYFLISFFSGMAATLAWTKQRELAEMTSGIAIAVTLLPPLAIFAIGLITIDRFLVNATGLIFVYNFLATLAGSLMIFILSRFSFEPAVKEAAQKELEKEAKE